ncbi:MAG: cysteine--tRNA ligase [Bacilli bacterium]|nr:cysteine--tRNA ligase [Bacilli bacterium]
MKIYNTLSRKLEEFVPHDKEKVTMYTCGPTVYHYAHIGNLRTYIFEDILEKTLNYIGYNVKRCMNITDVGHLTSDSDSGEDKMLKGAKREHKSVLEIADFYTNEFKKDIEKLNIKWPEIVSKATDNIDMYIKIVKKLLEDNYAYVSGGNVYFNTSKLEDYYKLTNHKIDEMVVGVREGVEEDLSKKSQNDFVLWFTKSKFDSQELKWDSPWGLGYPGWHIECSGISIKNLGEYLDIHCGGIDNIFPHHTNEIAQSEAYLGHKWCNYWIHGEHLNDETGKMSKSNGEFLTLSLLEEKGYNPLDYRFMCLNSSYRKVLVFSYDALNQAHNSYQKLKNKIKSLNKNLNEELNNLKIEEYKNKFKEALENDLNTSLALTVIYDLLKDDINDTTKIYLIEEFDKVLSLDLLKEEVKEIDNDLLEYINSMITKRNEAKQNKDYALADKIRTELNEKGILIKDTREGTIYEIK